MRNEHDPKAKSNEQYSVGRDHKIDHENLCDRAAADQLAAATAPKNTTQRLRLDT